jgi:hypothetical protein
MPNGPGHTASRHSSIDGGVIWQQPVTYPADGPPVGQLRHQLSQRAAGQRLGSRATRKRQEHVLIRAAAGQARPGREKLDRAARPVPDPADGQRARGGIAGSGPGVIRRDQGRYPLSPARIVRLFR